MPLNEIIINKGQGGLGRPLEGSDYISGIAFYSDATLPSGFTTNTREKAVFSVADAEALGITDKHLGETRAVAKVVVGGTPASGNTFKLTYTGIDGKVITVASLALTSGEAATTTTAAEAIRDAIRAINFTTGFDADSSTSTVTFSTKSGEGVFPNSGTPYAVEVTGGGMTATLTQPTGSSGTTLGVASDIDILHYHIAEHFRIQPGSKLWVGVYPTADVGTFANVAALQNAALGEIVQMAVYQKSTAFATSQTNALQSVNNTLTSENRPISSIVIGAEISATASVATINTNLRALSNPSVSVTIAQDGANKGYKLFKATGKSITNVGQVVGAIALSKVNESIAWLGRFQVASSELDTLAFANGQLYSSVSTGTVNNLDNLGFMLLRKVSGLSGSFHNRPYTCVSSTSDYAFVYSNRTMDKAIKNVRSTVLPALGSNVTVNSDGTLSIDAVNYFKSLASQGMDNLLRSAEISNYQIIINPAQNVLSTNSLVITVKVQPTGVADFITINIGFTTQL
jgi:hypothetical protein